MKKMLFSLVMLASVSSVSKAEETAIEEVFAGEENVAEPWSCESYCDDTNYEFHYVVLYRGALHSYSTAFDTTTECVNAMNQDKRCQ
jgi:hypothetical protein